MVVHDSAELYKQTCIQLGERIMAHVIEANQKGGENADILSVKDVQLVVNYVRNKSAVDLIKAFITQSHPCWAGAVLRNRGDIIEKVDKLFSWIPKSALEAIRHFFHKVLTDSEIEKLDQMAERLIYYCHNFYQKHEKEFTKIKSSMETHHSVFCMTTIHKRLNAEHHVESGTKEKKRAFAKLAESVLKVQKQIGGPEFALPADEGETVLMAGIMLQELEHDEKMVGNVGEKWAAAGETAEHMTALIKDYEKCEANIERNKEILNEIAEKTEEFRKTIQPRK